MSPAFHGFDERVFAAERARIVIAAGVTDIIANSAIAEFACQLTRRRGSRLSLTGLPAPHHRLLDRGCWQADHLLRDLCPEMLAPPGGEAVRAWIANADAGRVILAGADIGEAVAFGSAAGIALFLRRHDGQRHPPGGLPPRRDRDGLAGDRRRRRVTPPPAVAVEALVKRFGNVTAVDGVSFAVAAGSTTALLGGNGAGKTTTLAILLGLVVPTAGRVTVLGRDMADRPEATLARMNFSSPYVDLPRRLSVAENLMVYGRLYGVPRLKARIAALARDLDIAQFLDRPSGALSAGQRTRVALAKALLNEPTLLLLDEPTASLDPDTGDWIRSYLEGWRTRSGATILLASHNMAEVERLCDAAIVMRAGRIVDQGAPAALIARYGRRTMEEVFLDIARAAPTAPATLGAAEPEPAGGPGR